MRSISVELRFKIHKHRTTRGEFVIGDSLLKFCVTLAHFGVECGGVKFLPGYGKLVDEREVKTAEAFYGGIASAFRERRGAATRNEDRGIWSSFKSPILRLVAPTCQGLKSAINQPNLIRRLTKEAIAFAQFATTKTHANAGKESQPLLRNEFSIKRRCVEKFAPNYSEAANAAQR